MTTDREDNLLKRYQPNGAGKPLNPRAAALRGSLQSVRQGPGRRRL